ncbi:MAG: hypothetical protein O2856_17530 [Planctomycetota bacterium]|nr:hypothetical protein [Planctomycetota bacterium]
MDEGLMDGSRLNNSVFTREALTRLFACRSEFGARLVDAALQRCHTPDLLVTVDDVEDVAKSLCPVVFSSQESGVPADGEALADEAA